MGETTTPEIPQNIRESASTFWNYLNIHDDPKPADVIFILGGSSLKPVEKAAQLYRDGFAPKIAFISQGGRFGGETIWGMSETAKYNQRLLEMGIPQEAILAEENPEKQTRNTLAEAKAALPFLRGKNINPERIILVSRPIHQRRAYTTFMEQHPEVETYMNCPADEPLDMNNPEEVFRLVQEAERLLDYGVKKTDIQRPEIPGNILRAAAEVRHYLRKTGVYQTRTKPKYTQ